MLLYYLFGILTANFVLSAPFQEETAVDLVKRSTASFSAEFYRNGPPSAFRCPNEPKIAFGTFSSGQCHELFTYDTSTGQSGVPAYSATYTNLDNEFCMVKHWSSVDCTGPATVWWSTGGMTHFHGAEKQQAGCAPIANNNGVFTLGGGVRSFMLICSTNRGTNAG